MRIQFERCGDGWLRHDIHQAFVRTAWAKDYGDLSVEALEDCGCQLGVVSEPHTISLCHHLRWQQAAEALHPSTATMPPDVQRGKHIVASLPWPIKRARSG